ncbi:MAG: hypothetical protein QOC69_1939 [Mycobacterium sp.]|nr:hypothetical protein [Mycobacterium sp.]
MTAPDPQRSGKFALSTPERIGFGVGSLATATYAVVPGLVLLYYLTNILGVTAALAGLVVFLPKLLDLVYNPIVGRLSDSTVSRLGPRRPWMIAGIITFPLGFVSIFFSPFDGNAAAWWVAGALALTGLGFSAFVIPYSVLPAELGASPAERTSMTAWRMGSQRDRSVHSPRRCGWLLCPEPSRRPPCRYGQDGCCQRLLRS